MRDPGRNTWTFYEPAADGSDLLPPAPFDALADPSVEDLLPAGLAFWPRGAAWGTPDGQAAGTGTVLAGLTRALLAPFADLYRRAWLLTQESRALTLVDSLPDWEGDYGLPDACSPDPAEAARRRALLTRVRAVATITPQDFIQLARQEGFDIAIEEPALFECGFSECGGAHTVGDRIQEVYWIVHVYGLAVDYFRCGESECGHDPLFAVAEVDRLQCLFARLEPGWTQPVYEIYEAQAETDALVARMEIAPSAARKKLIDDLIVELKSWGIWQKLDLLYILAAHDAQAARLNWVKWTGTVTNEVRNNTAQGAVAGTPGTWPVGNPALASGLSRELVSVGVEDGIDYYDARIFGTPTASGGSVIYLETSTGIPGSPSQIRSGGTFVSLAGGSLDGISSLRTTLTVRDAAATAFAAAQTFFTPSAGPLRNQRVLVEGYALPVGTVYVQPTIQFNVMAGIPIDITLRIGLPQVVRMEIAGDPIRTTGAAVSETQSHQRFDLTPNGAPTFVADRGYAGGASSYLATGFNPATDGVGFTRLDAHFSVWDLTDRPAGDIIPMGVSAGTAVQVGMLHRYSTDRCALSVNDQSSTFANAQSAGFFVGSRQSSATRQAYRDGALISGLSSASVAVPSVPVDLLCFKYNNGANRGYWCTDRIAAFSMGAGLTAGEVSALHSALHAYLDALGALDA